MPCLGLTLVCPGGADEAGRTPGVALLHAASHLENSQLTGEGQVGGFALCCEPRVIGDNGIGHGRCQCGATLGLLWSESSVPLGVSVVSSPRQAGWSLLLWQESQVICPAGLSFHSMEDGSFIPSAVCSETSSLQKCCV